MGYRTKGKDAPSYWHHPDDLGLQLARSFVGSSTPAIRRKIVRVEVVHLTPKQRRAGETLDALGYNRAPGRSGRFNDLAVMHLYFKPLNRAEMRALRYNLDASKRKGRGGSWPRLTVGEWRGRRPRIFSIDRHEDADVWRYTVAVGGVRQDGLSGEESSPPSASYDRKDLKLRGSARNPRNNPTNLVKTAADERRWSKAKRIAAQSGRPDNYAYIVGIYKRMNAQETKPMRNPTHAILTTPVPKGGRALTSTERKKLKALGKPVHSRAIVVQDSGSEFYAHVYSPYWDRGGYFSEDIRVTTINRRGRRKNSTTGRNAKKPPTAERQPLKPQMSGAGGWLVYNDKTKKQVAHGFSDLHAAKRWIEDRERFKKAGVNRRTNRKNWGRGNVQGPFGPGPLTEEGWDYDAYRNWRYNPEDE